MMAAYEKVKSKLDSMSDADLIECYDALMSAAPSVWGKDGWQSYWNAEDKITMEDWADSVRAEITIRQLDRKSFNK